ncbi:alpha-1,2-fucosyltransferase [Marinomonas sp. ef1]|uniref:alpha-1,2-fucosyltransferase n=1 Tax=Marinomonas sp. ef1 TaxID=2005043 RepID=UPI000C28A890|nr:alpha-1,2-fucosyltransferase [Marinomonas sp. ef1]
MIITKLIGGLGNQMFQYSVGRSLSLQLNMPLYLDIKAFDNYELHQGFELNRFFSLDAKIANNSDLFSVLGFQSPKLVRDLIHKSSLTCFKNKSWIKEPSFSYWDGIKDLNKGVYLDGYWQSDLYFKGYEDVIRSDFQFQGMLDTVNSLLKQHIESCNSISLHIRRGDYLSNPNSANIHGVCPLSYYENAISYMNEKVDSPVYFVFSDDPEWVKDNLKFSNSSIFYLENNKGENSYKDMWLMSLCDHNIIANSTFSWWGAWLNANSDKIVISPSKWFQSPELQELTADLYCSGWIKF